jgi:2-oxoglutarate ferredoxin oxidoreductase subunit delta
VTTAPSQKFWRVPLDAEKITRLRGTVHILEERCKGCDFCVEFCPRGVLANSQRFNMKGYHPPDIVEPDACTGCHLCEIICPEFAIGVEERREEPIDGEKEAAHAG